MTQREFLRELLDAIGRGYSAFATSEDINGVIDSIDKWGGAYLDRDIEFVISKTKLKPVKFIKGVVNDIEIVVEGTQ